MLLEKILQNLNLMSLCFLLYISYFIVNYACKACSERAGQAGFKKDERWPKYLSRHPSVGAFMHSTRHCDLQSLFVFSNDGTGMADILNMA